MRELETKLEQSFIRGDAVERTTRDLAERMKVSLSNSRRLVQTESAFFVGQATLNGYKESNVVNQYEILSTLDSRTSEICRQLDGKVFQLSAAKVGVNYPPLHPNCRTTTTAYFDEDLDVGERFSRDMDGKMYHVPGDMKFDEWYDKYVKYTQAANEDPFIETVREEFEKWDKKNIKDFADNILTHAGLGHLRAQRHAIPANGQCALDPSSEKLKVKTFELNSKDNRSIQYRVKTAFHELFHAKSHGLVHDIHEIGFQNWAYYDDVFAESYAHYMVKQLGIIDEIAPSYAGYLIETLPKLKTLPEFKGAKQISDFGEVAYRYRIGSSSNAKWADLANKLKHMKFDIARYSQPYLNYMHDHSSELIDKMLENMPDFRQYRSNMLGDLDRAVKYIKKGTALAGNEKLIFENVLILVMNRLGVNEL